MQQAMAAVKTRKAKKEKVFDNEVLGAEGTQLQEAAQTAVFDGQQERLGFMPLSEEEEAR